MFVKLALRNVKRQASSYTIYFITVVFTVALMFAINNIFFSKELIGLLRFGEDDMTGLLGIFVGLVTLVAGFIITYATAFLLRKRKKEFGTYMLLGIRRFSVLKMFIIENLVIGTASLLLGYVAGAGVFQVIGAIVRGLIGREYLPPLQFEPNSIWLTLVQWAGIFIAATLFCTLVLYRSSITDLVGTKAVDKKVPKCPRLEQLSAFAALGILIVSIAAIVWLLLDSWIYNVSGNPKFDVMEYAVMIGILIIVAIAAILLFHFSMRGFFLNRLKKNTAYNGSNTFHYRQMSASLNRNAMMMGLTAALLSFTIVLTNMAFSSHYILVEQVNQNAEYFDIHGSWDTENYRKANMPFEITPDEVIGLAENSGIELLLQYNFYNSDWEGSGFSEEQLLRIRNTTILKESDYNATMRARGTMETELGDGELYLIFNVSDGDIYSNIFSEAFAKDASVMLFGKELTSKGILPATGGMYMTAVVSDNLLTQSEWDGYIKNTVLYIKAQRFIPFNLLKERLTGFQHVFGAFNTRSGENIGSITVYNKYAELAGHYAQSSISVVAALYVSLAFMFFAMALLSLKVMSDADLDKKRYAILNMLGVSAVRQRNIMLRQIFTFFAIPLLIPFAFVIPSVILSAFSCLQTIGYVHPNIYGIALAVPTVYAFIYLSYLAATYYLSVKNSITPLEKPTIKLLA